MLEAGNTAGQAETASATPPGPAPLRLDLPAGGPSTRSRSPALLNQALSDPRSNRPRLSASERFAIALGTLDCVIDERQPDGTILRSAGRRISVPTSSASADPFGHSSNTGGGEGGGVIPRRGGMVTICAKNSP